MMRLAAECQKIPPEPISDVRHLGSISGRHISRVSNPHSTLLPHPWFLSTRNHQRCSQFEDMIGKPDELRSAVANSHSRSVRTIRSATHLSSINVLKKYHVSSQTSFSRSNPSHQHFLVHPALTPPHALHRGHHSAERKSSGMQLTNHHHPLNHVAHAMRAARALRPPWVPTMT